MRFTGTENRMTRHHSWQFKGEIPKIELKTGTYRIIIWLATDPKMARMSQGLIQGGIVINELSSDKALRALNISIMTSTDKLSVDAFTFPFVKYSHGWA